MAEIKYIYEDAAQTKQIYPKTHERAVVDNNGTTAETKFGLLQELINQKQLEAGDVPIDLSPTKGNTDHIVSSDGVYESRLFDKETVSTDTWITGTVKGAINGSTYAKYESWDYPKFIPVTGGSMVRVTAGTQKRSVIAFVKNTTMSNGGAVPYATGETGTYIITVNTSQDFYVPSDANYIHASQKITESNEFPSFVVEMLDAKSATAVLRDEMKKGDAALEEKKQNKYYFVDLTNANIIASRDDINDTNNNQRATIRMQKCYKGDILTCVKPDGYSSASGKMLVRTFDKSGNRIVNSTAWIDTYTIEADGFYTAVVNSGVTSGGTAEFLLAALTQKTGIETIVRQYVDGRWNNDIDEITYKRMLLNNSRNIRQFTGKSPLEGQVRCSLLADFLECQSMAFYKDVVFTFVKGGRFTAYEYGTWRVLGGANSFLPVNEVEFNASWFSNEFYDANDEFPILYTEAIYTSPAVIGCRIQRANGVWSITKVHSIYRDGETGGAIVIYDQQKDQLVYASTTSLVTYQRPKFSEAVEGSSTLAQEDILSTVERPSGALDFGQDKSVYGNIAVGLSYSRQPNTIFGVDLISGEQTFSLPYFTNAEGEGVEWYNGRLYVCDVGGHLYEIVF